jgi:3-methyl-2-oxobutanoate hydroxymethyltransferase
LASTPEAKPYGTPSTAAPVASRVTVTTLAKMAADGQRIAMLTAYDASFAALAERAGVDVLLVGDSLGMVVQGHRTTLPVTEDAMLYHVRCVVAGCTRPLVIADLPFGSFQGAREDAFRASVAALKAGAQMVKIEGGAWIAPTVEYLTQRGVPVCGHVGLTPQSVNVLGGFKVQGRTDAAADALVADAQALARAGASLVVVECVPRELGARVAREAGAPVIGIGAGPDCAGQVLVVYDAIGIQPGRPARFVKNFMPGHDSVEAALAAYVRAVKDGSFPAPEHCF